MPPRECTRRNECRDGHLSQEDEALTTPEKKNTAGGNLDSQRLAPENAPCGLLCTEADGTILAVNRAFCEWTGFAADSLIGKRRLQDLFNPGGRIFHQTHWAPLLRLQGSVSEVKFELVDSSGRTVPMVFNAVLRPVEGGAILHDVATYIAKDRDSFEKELVASRRKLEQLIAETKQLHAEAHTRALMAEQMIGIVSHDLRNPLSNIALATQLLQCQKLSAEQSKTVARIKKATNRATSLISDLLDFTQAGVGAGLTVTHEQADFHEAVGVAIDELAELYPDRGIQHHRRGEGLCACDPRRIIQLVSNLVSNAVAYGAPDSPISVDTHVDESSFSVTVHNHGPPIPTEQQPLIFEPLTRGTSANQEIRSVGLGLFIVRQIAEAHGGTAQVRSSTDDGTLFVIKCPRSGSPH